MITVAAANRQIPAILTSVHTTQHPQDEQARITATRPKAPAVLGCIPSSTERARHHLHAALAHPMEPANCGSSQQGAVPQQRPEVGVLMCRRRGMARKGVLNMLQSLPGRHNLPMCNAHQPQDAPQTGSCILAMFTRRGQCCKPSKQYTIRATRYVKCRPCTCTRVAWRSPSTNSTKVWQLQLIMKVQSMQRLVPWLRPAKLQA